VSSSWMIPYLASWMYNGIVFGPPMECPPKHLRGRRHEGKLGPSLTLWSRHELWPLVVPLWPTCVMLSGYYPCKVEYRFESPRHPRKWVMACSPSPNIEVFNFILLWWELYEWWWLLCVIPRSEIAETKPPYVCQGCFIYTYSNNMINRCHVQ
jgi:hypothetical protein